MRGCATAVGHPACTVLNGNPLLGGRHFKDMVTTVATVPNSAHLLASGSEDGTVRLWDVRAGKSARILEPGVVLADHGGAGRWISAVAVDEAGSWLACGGGIPGLWMLAQSTLRFLVPAIVQQQQKLQRIVDQLNSMLWPYD